MSDKENPLTTEERYTSATHATSLVVDAERSGAGDVLIAAAWAPSRIGSALMRLHSEFDGAEKPKKIGAQATVELARMIARENKRVIPNDADLKDAREKASQWLLHEQKLQLGKLKTLPDVRGQLVLWSKVKGMESDPQTLVANTLMWWLDPTCHVCHGRRWQVVEGTPSLSERVCPAPECKGSGKRHRPGGMEGGMLLAYIDHCVGEARVSMKRRLRMHQEVKRP